MSRTVIDDMEIDCDVEKDLIPTGDQVLLKEIRTDRTEGGLILPNGERTSNFIGEVVAVGSGYTGEAGKFPMPFRKGWVLLTMQYMGHKIELRRGNYRMVREHGIWARVFGQFRNGKCLVERVWPYHGKLLVRPGAEEKTAGGIFLPTDPKVQYRRARVLNSSRWYRDMKSGRTVPMELHGDERIVMLRYAGSQLTVKGEELRLIDRQDVLFVIEEE